MIERGKSYPILDKGFIELVDYMGSDLTPVNAARVSFGKQVSSLQERDIKLLNYLKDHKHESPFRHQHMQFRIKAPEFVMRQAYKHVVGIEATSNYPTKDHAWSEISGRYVEVDEFYEPTVWRLQSKDNKQGSSGELLPDSIQLAEAQFAYDKALNEAKLAYKALLDLGIAREQARVILPLSLYTEVIWTTSFQALAHFIELRQDPHAQYEIRVYAEGFLTILKELFPETTKAYFKEQI